MIVEQIGTQRHRDVMRWELGELAMWATEHLDFYASLRRADPLEQAAAPR